MGQAARYPYLAGTYGAGDEIYVPIFPSAREIHLQINGDWIQSYIKDVQQNSQARVFGEVYATGIGLGDLAYYNAEATATATMFATQAGDAIAVISATSSGSGRPLFEDILRPWRQHDQRQVVQCRHFVPCQRSWWTSSRLS